MYKKLIDKYKELLEEALKEKRVFLDSGDYAGLSIRLYPAQQRIVDNLFNLHNAIVADWGKIIYLDTNKHTRMYFDTKGNFSVYVANFPTYGTVSEEYRENVDKFIHHLNSL